VLKQHPSLSRSCSSFLPKISAIEKAWISKISVGTNISHLSFFTQLSRWLEQYCETQSQQRQTAPCVIPFLRCVKLVINQSRGKWMPQKTVV
jgi:hypothetical protein